MLFEGISIFCRFTTLHLSLKIVSLGDGPTNDFEHHQLAPYMGTSSDKPSLYS